MLRRASLAGLIYFVAVFALGFALGAVRVLALEPALGSLWPVLIELPIMLAASWWICGRVIQRLLPGAGQGARLIMGASAFALLMSAELSLSVAVFGRTVMEHVGAWGSLHGALGLAGQIAFAAFPLFVARRGVNA